MRPATSATRTPASVAIRRPRAQLRAPREQAETRATRRARTRRRRIAPEKLREPCQPRVEHRDVCGRRTLLRTEHCGGATRTEERVWYVGEDRDAARRERGEGREVDGREGMEATSAGGDGVGSGIHKFRAERHERASAAVCRSARTESDDEA